LPVLPSAPSVRPSICSSVCDVDRLQRCVSAIRDWCASRPLQLNPSKTELIWFGSCASRRRKIADNDLSQCRYELAVTSSFLWTLCATSALPSTIDSQMTMQRQCARQQGRQYIFPSHPTSQADPTARWTRSKAPNGYSRFGVCAQQTGLLQCNTGRFA